MLQSFLRYFSCNRGPIQALNRIFYFIVEVLAVKGTNHLVVKPREHGGGIVMFCILFNSILIFSVKHIVNSTVTVM